MRRLLRILNGLLIAGLSLLICFLLAIYLILYIPSVQKLFAPSIASLASQALDLPVQVSAVYLKPFSVVELQDLLVLDHKNDTMLYCGSLEINILGARFNANTVSIDKIVFNRLDLRMTEHPGDPDFNLIMLIDRLDQPSGKNGPHIPFVLKVNRIVINKSAYTYRIESAPRNVTEFNEEDLRITSLNMDLHNFQAIDDSIQFRADSISGIDHSGLVIKKLSGDITVAPSVMSFLHANVESNRTRLSGDVVFMYTGWDELSDFEEKVKIESQWSDSRLSFSDLIPFSEVLNGIEQTVQLKGEIHGTIEKLVTKGIQLKFGNSSQLICKGKIRGVTDFETAFIQLDVEKLETNTEDLQTIPVPPFHLKHKLELPPNFYRFATIQFHGNFSGFPEDFVAFGSVETALGGLDCDITLRNNQKSGKSEYAGNVRIRSFDFGSFYDVSNVLGKASGNLEVAGSGFTSEDVSIQIKGDVSAIQFNNYEYHELLIDGHFQKNIFEGQFELQDPNALVAFNGKIDFSDKLPAFVFSAGIRKANLVALRWINYSHEIALSTDAEIDLMGDNADNLSGIVTLHATRIQSGEKELVLPIFSLAATGEAPSRMIDLRSDIAEGWIRGNFYFEKLPDVILSILKPYVPALLLNPAPIDGGADLAFRLNLPDPEPAFSMFYPSFIPGKNTMFEGRLASSDSSFHLTATFPKLRVPGATFFSARLESALNGYSQPLFLNIKCGNIAFADSLGMQQFRLNTILNKTGMNLDFSFRNDSEKANYMDIKGSGTYTSDTLLDFSFNEGVLVLEDSVWNLMNGNKIIAGLNEISIQNLNLKRESQGINVNGKINASEGLRVTANMEKFQLAQLNPLLENAGIKMSGRVDGEAIVWDEGNHNMFSSALIFQSLFINNEQLGNGSLHSQYNPENKSVSIDASFLRGELPTVSMRGFYYPEEKINSLDLEIQLRKTQLKIAEPFLTGIFSDLHGSVTGDLFLSGTPERPVLKGEADVMKGSALVDYINCKYTFNGHVLLAEDSIRFRNFYLFDDAGNEGTLSGGFDHKYFSDITMDMYLRARGLICLSTTAGQNELYYGKARADGWMRISGNFENIAIDIAAKTEKGTEINIPLSGPEEIAETKLIRFVTRDSSSLKISQQEKIDLSGIRMNFDLDVTPDAKVNMIFDEKLGDVISGTGTGSLKMNITPQGDFEMFGDYNINSGSYLFTLQNVINKKFHIAEGGTISWNGDPFEAEINLEAVYKLRASLYDVLPTDTSKARVPVSVNLKMTDRLMNPTIRFDIDLPTLDDRTRSDVRSAINVNNEAELNKQVFSLMMLGRFFPPSDRPATGSLGFAQNTSELLSSQLSNWLSQTNDIVNLGVKVQAGDQISSQELQVAMSTQLFSERLSIDGSFGVSNAAVNSSNLVGDVNAEYKLTSDGKLRVKAYYQSNDYTTLTNLAPYTQGLGLFYREEFDSFSMLFKKFGEKLRGAKALPADNKTVEENQP